MSGYALGVVAANGRQDLDVRFNERGRTPQDYGWTASLSVAASTAALQDWLDAIAVSGRGVVPNGIYVHDGSISITGFNCVIQFEDDAWLAPAAGWGLKCDIHRGRLVSPRVLLQAGTTATRGLWLNHCQRFTADEPVVWAKAMPTDFICIDVDDNAYWCKIDTPHIRKDSSSIVGSFAAGVRFRNESNAGRVADGDIAHCVDGVQVDGSNSVHVTDVAFEDVTNGIALLEPTIAGKNGAFISFGNRFESVTYSLDVRYSYPESDSFPIQHFAIGYSAPVNNPHSQPIALLAADGIRIRGANQAVSFHTGEVVLRESSGSFYAEADGYIILNADEDGNSTGNVQLRSGGVTIVTVDASGLAMNGGKITAAALSVSGDLAHTGTKSGVNGATPIAKAAAIATPTGGTTADAEARAAIASIITAIKNFGITA